MDKGAAGYRRFLEGDDGGIEEIIEEYKESLVLYLTGFCGSITAAEELMEDVFVKLVVDKPAFRGKSTFKTWLFAIAGNVARDYLRKTRRRSFVPLDELSSEPGEEEELLREHFRSEEKLMLNRCMEKLKPDYRQVLYLTFFEGFSNAEAGRIMKKTNRQIENLLYRAKQSLKAKMEEAGYNYEDK